MSSELFYVRVYRPSEVFECEVEVDPDLIGLDDESEAENTDPKREALRLALKQAKSGRGKQVPGAGEEFVALIWNEENVLSTHTLLRSSEKLRRLKEMTEDPVYGLMPDVRLKFLEILNPLLGEVERDESEHRGTIPDREGRELSGEVPEAVGEPEGGAPAGAGVGGPQSGGQRTATRNRRPRRVAPVQRRRRSRAGKGVADDG